LYLSHAFGQRYELPLPLLYFIAAGAIAVIASFLLIYRRPVEAEPAAATDAAAVEDATAPRLRWWTAAIALAGLALFAAAGIAGTQELAENIVPTGFWVVVWIVVPLSCGILGDWTRPLNPFRTLAQMADSPALRRTLLGGEERLAWSPGVAWWPAVAAFFALASGELIVNQWATVPRVTAIALLIWALVSAAMGLLVGAPAWLTRGEVFSVLFATWGRLGVFRFGTPGRRGLAGGLIVPFEAAVSRTVFVLLLLISVSFDGLLATPLWIKHIQPGIARAAGHESPGTEALTALAFALLGLVTLLVFGAFARAAARVGGHPETGLLAALRGLLPSLAPIAFGYLLAHNLQYILINGQLLIPLAGDPAGKGWSLLPAPFNDDYEIHKTFLPNWFYWYAGVVVIVAVHIAAVILAHRHLSRRTPDETRARRSELPWLVAMVGYTMLSLWLLAQPVTK
jgi:hypothetical protein